MDLSKRKPQNCDTQLFITSRTVTSQSFQNGTSHLNVILRVLLCFVQPQAAPNNRQHNCTDIDVNGSY